MKQKNFCKKLKNYRIILKLQWREMIVNNINYLGTMVIRSKIYKNKIKKLISSHLMKIFKKFYTTDPYSIKWKSEQKNDKITKMTQAIH